MKNILLVFEHSVEFDFIRVVLTNLGFNTMSLHKNPEVRAKLQNTSPDLVVTSALATSDEILKELIAQRKKTGHPKFVWVGHQQQYKKLTPAQMELIDSVLPTPIRPDKLIKTVCEMLTVPETEYIEKYKETQAKSSASEKSDRFVVVDKERRNRYAEALTKVENLDRTLNIKEITKGQPSLKEQANSPDLLEKKKDFVKALFKK